MAAIVKFTKMQGAGNDYIYIYGSPAANPACLARRWSDRHTGIGSDGLVLIGRSTVPEADFTMRIFNADGSEALMCGNASRCIGKYVYEKGLTDKTSVRLLTRTGVKTLTLHTDGDRRVKSVTVDMQEPCLADRALLATPDGSMREGIVTVCGQTLHGTFVSMGNPHFVVFADKEPEDADVVRLGGVLETHPLFPERCNVEFATTGACATAVAAHLTGRAGRKCAVVMDGGTLEIEWSEADNHVYMTGPAEIVFEGQIEI